MTLAIVLVAAYLLGSIPTSYLVVYKYTGRDIRSMGTGNPGTMNVLDSVGMRPALIVGTVDILKGIAAVGVAYLAGVTDVQAVLAAAVAIMGHDYSVFLRLNGGNGMATGVGGIAGLLPLATFVSFSLALTALLILRSRRRAGVIGLLLIPVMAYWFDASDAKLIGVFVLLTIMAIKIIRFEGFSPARIPPDR